MELKEFVSTALTQIVEGVRDAQSSATGDAEVNPSIWMNLRQEAAKHGILESNGGKWIYMVEFDVAVTAGAASGAKGGIGVFAGAVSLGSQRSSSTENTTLSRLRFSVPIAYPRSGASDGNQGQ